MSARMMYLFLVFFLCAAVWGETERGLVAHWDFNEGKGGVLHDRSGDKNDGKIHGAKWVKCGQGHALKFGRSGDYVDFGDNPRLKAPGDMTIAAWVKPMASPFPDRTTNWGIVNYEKYRKSGFELRLAGTTGKLYYRSSQPGTFQHGLSTTKLQKGIFYHLVVAKKGNTVTFYVDGVPDARFSVKDPAPGPAAFTISAGSQSFNGLIDDIRIYNRALPIADILNLYKKNAASLGKDVSWFGKLKVTPFFRFDEKNLLIEADLRGVLPLKDGEQVVVELARCGQKPIEQREVTPIAKSGKSDFTFALDKLSAGEYEIRVVLRNDHGIKTQERVAFHYPPLPVAVVSPKQKTARPLPPAPEPVRYDLDLCKGGGFRVGIKGKSYPVESSFSYPHGGDNKLTASDISDDKGEPAWNVKTERVGASTYRVTATGKYYRINREIELQLSRVLVKDTITNISNADVGIMLSNHIDVRGKKGLKTQAIAAPNPPGFVHAKDHGLGILPLDDVYQVQQKTYAGNGICGVKSDCFGLAAGASYTLEWAVYPTGSGDYYDLINAVRKDEGLDNRTIDGCLSITHSGQWLRESPPKELVEFGGLKYASSGCVTKIADDPGISFEGIEFVRYPKEREALRKNYAQTKKLFPRLKVMFHVAFNIYATNKPGQTFPDSRIIAKSGQHEMYGSNPSYFSEERQKQGWAWYPYYPTLDNSFGKELLESVDVMMDEIGVDGVFADGLLSGYGAASSNYPTGFVATYGKWDGHTVEIDPGTKTIRKKVGLMVLLGRDALIAYIRKINSKGGRVIINHMKVVPRSFAKENAFYCAETNDGDFRCASLHLAPTVIGLANPSKFGSVQAIYDDIRAKLDWGALYIYYWWGGASQLTHPMITTEMFPITVTEIRSGTIKGRERIITTHSGVYGWRGDRNLHCAVLSDARGRMVPCNFLTTVDHSGVRTEIVLRDNETAVLKKIPITLQSGSPVNLVVEKYGPKAVLLTLNGNDGIELQISDGDFPIKPEAVYIVKADGEKRIIADKSGTLRFKTELDGQLRLWIESAEGR